MTVPESRRLVVDRFGGVDGIRLVASEVPVPGPGEIRVRVRVAGLNPVDWQIVESAELAARFGVHVPCGYGNDFVGVVDALGPGVRSWRVGDRAFGGARGKAVADHIVVTADDPAIRRTPADADDLTAGVIDIAGRTASAVADRLALTPADTVLIGAAAGGVGTILTQLAVASGARVLGSGGPGTFAYLGSLGVEPVRYGPGLADEVRRTAPAGLTAAADLYDSRTALTALELGVAAHRIATIEAENPPPGVHAVNGRDARPDALDELLRRVTAGRLHIPVEATFSIEDYHEAIARQARRHAHGKLAIVLDDAPGSAR